MKELFLGIPKYVPEICPHAKRIVNHFECQKHAFGCTQIRTEERHICPCFGKNGGGWISCTDEDVQKMIDEVKRWNECRKTIPQKTAFKLKGFDGFHIHKHEILVDQFDETEIEERKKQIIQLLENGDRIGFNEDWGVGNIEKTEKGFTATTWYYGTESQPVVNGTIEGIIEFLFSFWGNSEAFSYTKAGYPELERKLKE